MVTEPCPLPTISSRAARNAAEGMAAERPAPEPIWTHVNGFSLASGAVTRATIALTAGSPHR